MKLKRSAVVSPVSNALIDAVMDGYVTWREESAAVETAYRNWRGAPLDERALAIDDYFAALDREERAATEYRRLIAVANGVADRGPGLN